jgi:hypothetical protein
VHVVAEKGQRRITDFLVLETLLATWFWLPYQVAIVTDRSWIRLTRPWIGEIWFGLWIASPFLTLVGLLMIPRALLTPGGWVQVAAGTLFALSIWYQFRRFEFFPD